MALEHEPELDEQILEGLLPWTPEEENRRARFGSVEAKTSWCMGRALVCAALAAYAGIPDAHRHLKISPGGKPFIPDCALGINWSHAAGCVVLALSAKREVGVDIVAARRPRADFLAQARRFFRPDEAVWVEAGSSGCDWERFLALFVQKEARLKLSGEGLAGSLAGASAVLTLPPHSEPDAVILETSGRRRFFIAADAAPATAALQFVLECLSFAPGQRAFAI